MNKFNHPILLLLTLTLSLADNSTNLTVYPAIIIGAGMSGIASSKQLSQQNIPHLILQARDRIGGRIASDTLNGTQVDLGATFVHNPLQKNSIDTLIHQMGWPTIPAKFYLIEEYYRSGKELSATENQQSSKLMKQFIRFLYGYVKSRSHNIGLLEGWEAFYQSKKALYSERILERTYFQLMMEGLTSGADVRELSSREFLNNKEKGINDYIPKTGYFELLKAIFHTYCTKATIKFQNVVTAIDYSNAVIKVITKNGDVYYAKKVICSIPLGVLKAGDVKFTPALPSGHQEAIQKIGMGTFNKIIVSFSDYFWTKGMKVLDFIPLYSDLDYKKKFLQGYVVSDSNPSLVMFFTGGSTARDLSHQADSVIIQELVSSIKQYIKPQFSNFSIKGYKITRWDQDPYAKGSYSFFSVNTTKKHFLTMSTPVHDRLFFVGEHTDHSQSSNVHGAFHAGTDGAVKVSASLSTQYLVFLVASLLIFILF